MSNPPRPLPAPWYALRSNLMQLLLRIRKDARRVEWSQYALLRDILLTENAAEDEDLIVHFEKSGSALVAQVP